MCKPSSSNVGRGRSDRVWILSMCTRNGCSAHLSTTEIVVRPSLTAYGRMKTSKLLIDPISPSTSEMTPPLPMKALLQKA
jgi:hypothetical protein